MWEYLSLLGLDGYINLSQQVQTCKLHKLLHGVNSRSLLMWENSVAKDTADLWVEADFQSRTRITVNSWLGVRVTVGRDLFGGCSWVMERMNLHGTHHGSWIWRVSRLIEEERLRGSGLGMTYLSSKERGSCPRIKIEKWVANYNRAGRPTKVSLWNHWTSSPKLYLKIIKLAYFIALLLPPC